MAYSTQAARHVLFGGSTWYGPGEDTWSYDYASNTWTNLDPTAHPSPRPGAAMAYDQESNRFVLFGGSPGYVPSDETWVYDPTANTWIDMAPAVRPQGRFWTSMAYDAPADRIILFGGHLMDGGLAPVENDETWAYDYNTNSWTDMDPASRPAGRFLHAMTFDSRDGRTLLQGGKVPCAPNPIPNPACINGETWAYDFAANSWTQLALGPPRVDHAIAFDAGSNRTVLFGGSEGSTQSLGDTWIFDGNQWTNANPVATAPPWAGHTMAYDVASDLVVLFASYEGNTPGVLWTYNTDGNMWSSRSAPPHPNVRAGHAMGYDPRLDRVVLFGGNLGGRNADTWTFDLQRQEWTRMAPAVSPSPRVNAAMVYDTGAARLILFGGDDGTMDYNDETWAYDLATNAWTDLNPSSKPPPRRGHALAYDETSGRVVLFGGEVSRQFAYEDDVWLYDSGANAWTRRDQATKPPARANHALVYDGASGRVVLFGGNVVTPPYFTNDTWTYDTGSNLWRNVTRGPSPSPRSAVAAAYDSQANRAIVFGGWGSYMSTRFDDTWSYDASSGAWRRLDPNPHPSPRAFSALAYDSQSRRTILYGGEGSDETWAYDYVGPLDVRIEAVPASGPAPLDVVFLLNVSGGTPPYSFAWTFADGSTSSVREPVHTYPSEGSFQVTVTVGESSGSNVSASVRVTVTRTQAPLWAVGVVLGAAIASTVVFIAWRLRRGAWTPPKPL